MKRRRQSVLALDANVLASAALSASILIPLDTPWTNRDSSSYPLTDNIPRSSQNGKAKRFSVLQKTKTESNQDQLEEVQDFFQPKVPFQNSPHRL